MKNQVLQHFVFFLLISVRFLSKFSRRDVGEIVVDMHTYTLGTETCLLFYLCILYLPHIYFEGRLRCMCVLGGFFFNIQQFFITF